MQRISIALVSLALLAVSGPLAAAEDARTEDISIALAVKEFNQRMHRQQEAAGQLPLTEDEVIAAIRSSHPQVKPGLTEEMYARFQQIAESQVMPPGAYLTVIQVSHVRGYVCQVWHVVLTIKTGENTGATLRLRDQCISSRKIRPEEQRELEQRLNPFKGDRARD